MINVLYVFGGEKAAGAEIVIDRLISKNKDNVNAHLFISPGLFATGLKQSPAYTKITELTYLKKLNRRSGKLYLINAIRNYLVIPLQVISYCKKHNIQIVHGNTLTPSSYLLPAIWLSKLIGYKVKWVWSDHDITYFSKLDIFFAKKCARWFDLTLVVSKATAIKYNGIAKIKVLYNGLDTAQYNAFTDKRTIFRERHGFAPNDIVFGIAATIEVRKGQLILIQEFLKLVNLYPNIFLLIAGHSSAEVGYVNEVITIARTNTEKIELLGKVTDMVEFYNGIDCLINNSNITGSEPLGTSIYEAMACEKFAVGSNVGGTAEIVDHMVDGVLFDPNGEALAIALKNVIENYNTLASKLSNNARSKVINKFNIDVTAKLYNTILQEL